MDNPIRDAKPTPGTRLRIRLPNGPWLPTAGYAGRAPFTTDELAKAIEHNRDALTVPRADWLRALGTIEFLRKRVEGLETTRLRIEGDVA